MTGGNVATIRELRERLLSVPLDDRAPDLAMDGFRHAFRCSLWGTHRMTRRGSGYCPEFLEHDGASARQVEGVVSFVAHQAALPFLYDPERPQLGQRNRVHVTHVDDVPETARPFFAAAGLAGLHQIRIVVCDGPELLGWFGGFRPDEPFTSEDVSPLRRLVPALRTAFLWKRRLARVEETIAGFEAVMNALACPAFVVRGGRTLEHVNRAGRPLVETHGRSLVAELVERARAGEAERVALTARGVTKLELFVVRGPSVRLEAALARAGDAWSLTPRQREVLALVAAGDVNKSIATKLTRAEVTVEVHVTALLRKSGAATRTELVARLWALLDR
ncbi:MAG TPA: helix-turn-helix transcriptional regulator [Labilithrix sp.]|nr:helix-turn-helix transcriptional regulator [Labilithrix sp.]